MYIFTGVTPTDEKSIVDNHCYHITTVSMCAVGIEENQEKTSLVNKNLVKFLIY